MNGYGSQIGGGIAGSTGNQHKPGGGCVCEACLREASQREQAGGQISAADHAESRISGHAGECSCGSEPAESDQAAHDHCDHDHAQEAHSHEHCGHDHAKAGHNHEHSDHDHSHDGCCCGHDHDHIGYDPTDISGIQTTADGRAVYRIDNMDCPMEEALIRDKLKNMSGIKKLEFNLMKRVLTVYHELESLTHLEAALHSIDMKPVPILAGQKFEAQETRIPWLRLGLAGLLALGAEVAHFIEAPHWLVFIPALAAILLGGLGTYKKGWIALKNLNLNMNALMSFAVTGAAIIGQWPEAAMVMVLFNVAEAIEAKSLARAREAIGNLVELAPEKATVKKADGDWQEMTAAEVPVGSLVRVRPGEKIALDGVIVKGSSAVNQAPITGESLPVDKGEGDQVFAGTINEAGSFEFEVTSPFGNSTLARIIRAVEEAQATKAPIQRFVDSFAKVYTPIVFVVAVLVAVIPPLALGGAWLEWIYRALVLLVIACPCALVISTPVTIVSALAAATRHGLLIKGGAFLEEGRKLGCLLLDKTGTITTGRPVMTDLIELDKNRADSARLAAYSLASRSDHPVSKAIAAAVMDKTASPLEVEAFQAVAGRGVEGRINGEIWKLGSLKYMADNNLSSPELIERVEALEGQGKSVVGIFNEGGVYLLLAVADSIKKNSAAAIAELKRMGVKTIMLTGDNQKAADAVAREVGVDEARGNLLPEDKLAAVRDLSKQGLKIGMAGDGINDAPALAQADIGFAMATAGTGAAIETADVALMDDDLGKIPVFIRLSKSARAILMQNITLAIGIKMIFFVLTFVGYTSMWMAVFADIGVSLMVVFNGLRMLRK